MLLRTRIAAVASLSVALAVLAAAIGAYLAARADLRGQLDSALRARATALSGPVGGGGPGGAGGPTDSGPAGAGDEQGLPPRGTASGADAAAGSGTSGPTGPGAAAGSGTSGPTGPGAVESGPTGPSAGAPARSSFPSTVRPPAFGAASGYVQFVSPNGSIAVPGGQGSSRRIALTAADLRIAASGRGSAFSDRSTGGTHLRVLTLGAGPRGAVLVALPLTEVDHELSRLELLLAAIGLAGIVLAGAFGMLVARTALAPIARFTQRAERVAGRPTLDLSQRLEVTGRDELARLARSFNATLDALARSVDAQRQLIADASHELRTPIASLRANIQVLQDASRLAPAERESLRRDVVQELDELTALIADVTELARGAERPLARDDVQLDALVRSAARRAERRAGDVQFALDLQPTLLSADAPTVERAVANLLENARKWSPRPGTVEVSLHDGELTVRDHGPGFEEHDLPHVFDRFYRAPRARAQPGSGLGLAIVRQAAESHGGYARAENAPGGGALLRVQFGAPIAQGTPLAADQ